MVNISIYLIIILIVCRTFYSIKLIFEFSKSIGGGRGTSCLLRREIGKNVIKYIHVYNVDI